VCVKNKKSGPRAKTGGRKKKSPFIGPMNKPRTKRGAKPTDVTPNSRVVWDKDHWSVVKRKLSKTGKTYGRKAGQKTKYRHLPKSVMKAIRSGAKLRGTTLNTGVAFQGRRTFF
jgi:site-specific DNA-cytosine methylase